mgnify:CR=1 FL=1|jgi:hypothetical protein
MIKKGDKVYYYQTMNRVGIISEIIKRKNTNLTVGGTSESNVYVIVEYQEGDKITYKIGDVQKHFD